MLFRVYMKNSEEYELFQKVVLVLGYRWRGEEEGHIYGYDPINPYLGLWDDGRISRGSSISFPGVDNMTFNDFIEYIHKNDIRYDNR